jgi:hypothetical protein
LSLSETKPLWSLKGFPPFILLSEAAVSDNVGELSGSGGTRELHSGMV